MNIALIGYGNMGREIERLVTEGGNHQITSISMKTKNDSLDRDSIQNADVAIDFTSPEVVMQNIKEVMEIGTPLVVGTTGWYEKLSEVTTLVEKTNGALIYGQNFSIGANAFFAILAYASSVFSRYKMYDVFGLETHHVGKKDSPSGTARKLADIILQNFPQKKVLQTEKLNRQIRPDELHFASVRGGRNFGRHEIVFDSQSDAIHLTHEAWGRQGFAEGAILAAEFIKDKKGIYDFSEVFQEGERR